MRRSSKPRKMIEAKGGCAALQRQEAAASAERNRFRLGIHDAKGKGR